MTTHLKIAGDVSLTAKRPVVSQELAKTFCASSGPNAINIEGCVLPEERSLELHDANGVFNTPALIPFLNSLNINIGILANNHISDFDQGIKLTCAALRQHGIEHCGAGRNAAEAQTPVLFDYGTERFVVLAFGWPPIGCKSAGPTQEGVNPLQFKHVFASVNDCRSQDNEAVVICVMHWNYELEKWPQPAHRQLAFDLIDAGVDAVIGMHSHIPQGAEIYKGKLIAYGLGNFWMPPRQVGNLWMDHGADACCGLITDLSFNKRTLEKVQFHWTRANYKENKLSLIKTEDADGKDIRTLTPFSGLSNSEYIKWFKQNRKRRKLLPIYTDYRCRWKTAIFDAWVNLRHCLIGLLVRSGVKKSLS